MLCSAPAGVPDGIVHPVNPDALIPREQNAIAICPHGFHLIVNELDDALEFDGALFVAAASILIAGRIDAFGGFSNS